MTQATKIADTFPIVMMYGGDTHSYSLKIQDNRDEFPGHSDFTLHGQITGFGSGGGNHGAENWLRQQGVFGEVDYDAENGEFFAYSDNLATLVQLVYALRNHISPDCDAPIAQMGGRDLSVTPGSRRKTLLADWADGSHTEAWAAMIKRETKAPVLAVTDVLKQLKYRITIEVEIPDQGNGPEKIGNIARMINQAAWQGADAYYGSVTVTDEKVS